MVGQKNYLFSHFWGSFRVTLTKIEISQFVKNDLQRILGWFIEDYFQHNLEISIRRQKKLHTTE